jgi:ethanolamine ammonia-lyase small subunit
VAATILCDDPRIVNQERVLKIVVRNREEMDRNFRDFADAASHQSGLRDQSFRLTAYLVPAIITPTMGIGANDSLVVPDTWRPTMNIQQSNETCLTNLRDISTCPLSFY